MRLELESIFPQVTFDRSDDASAAAENALRIEAKALLTEGIKLAQAGERGKARVSLLRSTELDPKSETAWLWLASISEYPEELLIFLTNVLEINPENRRAVEWTAATKSLLSKTFVQRGADAFEENRADYAVQCFNQALEYDQNNAAAWLWLASLCDSDEGKITYFEKVLAIDSNNDAALNGLRASRHRISQRQLAEARAAAVAGRSAEANEYLDAIIAENPGSEDAWILRAHLAEGFEAKILAFEKVLELNPDNFVARSGRESLLSIIETVKPPEPRAAGVPTDAVPMHAPAAEEIPGSAIELVLEPARGGSFLADGTTEPQTADLFEESEPTAALENHELPVTTKSEEDEPAQTHASPFLQTVVEWSGAGVDAVEYRFESSVSNAAAPVESIVVEEEVYPQSHEVFDSKAGLQPETQPDHENSSLTEHSAGDAESDYAAVEYAATDEAPTASESGILDAAEISAADVVPAIAEPADPPAALERVYDSDEFLPSGAFSETTPDDLAARRTSICAFCGGDIAAEAVVCHHCSAVLTLSNLEMLISSMGVGTLMLRDAVERMESERQTRELTRDELVTLGIGHLNLQNYQYGFDYLVQASLLNPDDVVLDRQVNALRIRLEETRRRDDIHDSMPRGKTILIVDDSPTVRRLVAGKLEKCGHDVLCASDGVEALDRLRDVVPDLVLLDINMPRMDGYQVCKMIRSNTATQDVPVVMISGKDGFFDKVRGRMAGTTGYITKPFGPETLMKAVETYLSENAFAGRAN